MVRKLEQHAGRSHDHRHGERMDQAYGTDYRASPVSTA
jgi:hypothetical protein